MLNPCEVHSYEFQTRKFHDSVSGAFPNALMTVCSPPTLTRRMHGLLVLAFGSEKKFKLSRRGTSAG